MTIDKARAAALIAHLISEHEIGGRSWRDIAGDYPGVTFQMLNKIARTGKMPKDKRILQALGVWGRPGEEFAGQRRIRRKIARTAKETRETLK